MSALSQTIGQFAEQILFSDSLAAKLLSPGELSDSHRLVAAAPFRTPDYPTRPLGLELNNRPLNSSLRPKIHFPSRASLAEDRARGIVLHFFANHELLALELMALALLKWPDAPEGFRRGLIRTMTEEQSHMRLYLDRMRDLNVEFGETKLNSFFWDCLKGLKSPMEFAAAMAMTFEQANIDFALLYERLFREEGDLVSASIMQRVREEEIGHVKHGVIWFERWRPKHESLFSEWQGSLVFPITPARAKGTNFDREGRLRAGLPSDFINELEVHNQSKGRPPRLFWFNPGCEQEIEAGSLSWTAPKAMQQLKTDYASLLGLLTHQSDIVLVDNMPSVEHLQNLASAGFDNPEFVCERSITTLKVRKFWSFEPWGWSTRARNIFSPLKSRLVQNRLDADRSKHTADASVFSKTLAAEIRKNLGLDTPPTLKCSSREAVTRAIKNLADISPTGVVVLKSSFSASGRGMIRIKNETIDEKQLAWVESIIAKNGHVLVEPWLEKVLDLSAHVDISADGTIRFLGFTRFWTDPRGQYKGHILGRILDDFGPDILERWHQENGWKSELQSTALAVGREIFSHGYYGPMGIDAFIYRQNGEFKLRPLVEINPRYSMGRLALYISKRITAKRCGTWIHVSAADLSKTGHNSFQDLLKKLQAQLPMEFNRLGPSRTINQGAIALNDPTLAKQSLAILVVGEDLTHCYKHLNLAGIDDSYLDSRSQVGAAYSVLSNTKPRV